MQIEEFLQFMGDVKIYDLTQRLSIHTPPWPSYIPLQIQYFKRIAGAHMGQGANGQVITTSHHVGTHMDGEKHFYANGRTIGDTPLDFWYGPGVVVDISDAVGDYDIYTPDMLTSRVEIKEGDILIIKTGYSEYAWDKEGSDEIRYFVKHPGPGPDFHKWALEKKIKWIGVDCGSADHPMNTIIADWHPGLFKEAEKQLIEKHGVKNWEEMFPSDEYYQVMHLQLFPKGLIHAENVGGDLDRLGSQRLWIGCFPLRGVELASSMCRIIAMKPPE